MKESLTNRLSEGELLELCALTQGEQNNHLKEELYQLTLDMTIQPKENNTLDFVAEIVDESKGLHVAYYDLFWMYSKHAEMVGGKRIINIV